MDLGSILKTLQSLGLSPLEILTIIALIILYRKNETLYAEVLSLEHSLDECITKISPPK